MRIIDTIPFEGPSIFCLRPALKIVLDLGSLAGVSTIIEILHCCKLPRPLCSAIQLSNGWGTYLGMFWNMSFWS